MKIGIIREGKNPPDERVALSPKQAAEMQRFFGIQVVVEPSSNRCFSDDEYAKAGLELTENLSDCDALLGVKEVPVSQLLEGKTYFFFSHTIKKQPYNRPLLQAVLAKKIRLIDWETLTDERGGRLIAFGKYAGVVGAHNGLWAYGLRTKTFNLPRLFQCRDYSFCLENHYKKLVLPPVRIVLTGSGRVAAGARKVLEDLKIREVSASDFLKKDFDEAVFTNLHAADYARRKDGQPFLKSDFYADGSLFESAFEPFFERTDLFMNGIFYDKKAPAFFTLEDMKRPDFRIRTIADITCDIAPAASVPATLRATTILDPIFGFYPKTGGETAPFSSTSIDVMAVDNLPNELPRDASEFFGRQFLENILPELLKKDGSSGVFQRAAIARDGFLQPNFEYLKNWAEGAE